MDNNPIGKKRAEQEAKRQEEQKHSQLVEAVKASGNTTKDGVTTAIHDLMLATLVAKDPRLVEVAKNLGNLLDGISKAAGDLKNSPLKKLPDIHDNLVKALKSLPAEVAKTDRSPELIPYLEELTKAVRSQNTRPTVKVDSPEVDLKPLIEYLTKIEKAVKGIETPQNDFSELRSSIEETTKAIRSLEFPIANYVLPFSSNGKAAQVALTTDGAVPVDLQDTSVVVSGEVTANAGTNLNTSALALDATLTGGTQKSQLVDPGGEAVTVTGGKLDVNATISGSGGGTASIDDSAFTVGTDSGTPVMGLFDDVTPDSVNEGDVGVLRMSGNRNAYTTIRDSAGNERGVNVTAGNALVVDGSATTQPVSGTFWQATQPVSGTVTANAGTNLNTSALALAATQTDKSQFTKLTDGTDTALITAAGEQNVIATAQPGVDIGDVTVNNAAGASAVNIQDGGNTITVDGTVSITANSAINVAQVAGATAQSGSGTATGALRVELPTNGTGVIATVGAVTAITNALPAGTNAIGKLAANSGVDIGDVDVTSAVSGTLDHGGNTDVDTAAEQITATSFACKFGMTIRSSTTNTGLVWIGNSDVTAGSAGATDGMPLSPGDSLFLPVSNSNIPYAIASVANQILNWIAV